MLIKSLPILILLTSCASQPLTKEEKNVRVLRKSDASRKCKELSNVHAPGLGSITDEGRIKDLKRVTHKAGGNTVTINRRDENNTTYGTTFNCPK